MDDLQARIAALAHVAVRHALQNYQMGLDHSPESLRRVDKILGQLHNTLPRGALGRLFSRGATPKQIADMATAYGAYIGEVIRKRWGGEWSVQSTLPGEPTMTLHVLGEEIYPADKAYKRLVNGQEDSIWAYYQVLARDLGKEQTQEEPGNSAGDI